MKVLKTCCHHGGIFCGHYLISLSLILDKTIEDISEADLLCEAF
jgi:hypothetical protein